MNPTPRSAVRRLPKRAHYDRAVIDAILDEALVCHIAFIQDGAPIVIPTGFVRVGDELIVHGSAASRLIKTIASGVEVCVTATLLDGLVLARSAFHHSMNYRSVVFFGRGREVTAPDELTAVMRAFTNKVHPGRWEQVREPNAHEWKATRVAAIPITEASAKIRTGGPIDDAEDYALNVWAGVIPLKLTPGEPVQDTATAPPA